MSSSNKCLQLICWGGGVITLFFWAPFNDPFNAPKAWLLSLVGFWLLGWLFFSSKDYWNVGTLKYSTILGMLFASVLCLDLMFTDNKFIGVFGEYQRNTGFLTYFCLIVFYVSSSYLFRLNTVKILERVVLTVGFLTSFYSFFQHFHHDFIHWNNPYNPVLSTLGNPDFAGAVMSILAILNFGILIQKSNYWLVRLFATVNTFLLIGAILFSHVLQGVLTSIFGITLVFIVWIFQRHRKVALSLICLEIIFAAFALAGMLSKGPLTKYFYKPSVSYRGDYWRAAWKMFTSHPIFGVGLDRYGYNFRKYRDVTQSLHRGPQIVSSAAHNVPLQLAATGGILLFVAYASLACFIFVRGVLALRRTSNAQQITVAIIFASWIAYQLQSFISIDNVGVVVWGYILGGAVVGISIDPENATRKITKSSKLWPIASGVLAVTVSIPSVLFLQSEMAMAQLNKLPLPSISSTLTSYVVAAQKPVSNGLSQPAIQLSVAEHLAQANELPLATSMLEKIIDTDHKYFDAQELLARIYEYEKNWKKAIILRKNMYGIDPYNQVNLLQLGEDEKSIGNLSAAKSIRSRIISFAPLSQEAKKALADLGN